MIQSARYDQIVDGKNAEIQLSENLDP